MLTQKKLLELYGHPRKLYAMNEKDIPFFLDDRQRLSFMKSKNEKALEASYESLVRAGNRFIYRESKDYPHRLLELYDAPFGFYLKGRYPDEIKHYLAVVGAREPSDYGLKIAFSYSEYFASMGIGIISGMAKGIDRAAHMGALQAGGYSLGILGGGIDTMYPKSNFNLYFDMYQRGGILSEYNQGISNSPGLFPRRNRLIAALSDAIFVVEAKERSGSLITADSGLELGKDIFSLPGRVTDECSKGCNQLISQGAYIVTKPEDILEYLQDFVEIS